VEAADDIILGLGLRNRPREATSVSVQISDYDFLNDV